MTDNEITTEELLSMRVVPEQQADLAVVQDALGTQKADPTEELRRMTYQRDAWRDDALAAEQRIDALKERLADRDAQLDQAKTARARDLVRYSQDEMFLRLMAAEADRDAAEAALAQLTGITPLPAAPVGGQDEPSDAAKHTIAWTLDANRGCIEGRITCHAGPGDPCHRACRCEDASCYCGGATMEDIDFCNPLAFIENEDDVSLIERYDGADETLRDGPVELVWMPDGETYGWRYAAAAVSGEHQDTTKDAQPAIRNRNEYALLGDPNDPRFNAPTLTAFIEDAQ